MRTAEIKVNDCIKYFSEDQKAKFYRQVLNDLPKLYAAGPGTYNLSSERGDHVITTIIKDH